MSPMQLPMAPCPKCGGETPFRHLRDLAHRVAETHMPGSERFECAYCKYTVRAPDPNRPTLVFTFDHASPPEGPQESMAPSPAPSTGVTTMDFGRALAALKAGQRVARQVWNGKGMWLTLVPGSTITVQGTIVPWIASQSDLLSEDWVVLARWDAVSVA